MNCKIQPHQFFVIQGEHLGIESEKKDGIVAITDFVAKNSTTFRDTKKNDDLEALKYNLEFIITKAQHHNEKWLVRLFNFLNLSEIFTTFKKCDLLKLDVELDLINTKLSTAPTLPPLVEKGLADVNPNQGMQIVGQAVESLSSAQIEQLRGLLQDLEQKEGETLADWVGRVINFFAQDTSKMDKEPYKRYIIDYYNVASKIFNLLDPNKVQPKDRPTLRVKQSDSVQTKVTGINIFDKNVKLGESTHARMAAMQFLQEFTEKDALMQRIINSSDDKRRLNERALRFIFININ